MYVPDYRSLEWEGHRIAWWETRAPDPAVPDVLLLHGFPSSSRDWHGIADRLRGRCRVVSFDLLGYGRSDKPADVSYSVYRQTDLAAHVLASLCAPQSAVVGHDLGGIILQELLRRDREAATPSVGHACFMNSSVYAALYRPTRAQKLLTTPLIGSLVARRMTEKAFTSGVVAASGEDTPDLRAHAHEMWCEFTSGGGMLLAPKHLVYMKERARAAARLEAAMEAKADDATPSPLSFVYGAADPVSGQHQLDRIAHRIPQAAVTSIAGAGHFPMLEAPDAVASALLETVVSGACA